MPRELVYRGRKIAVGRDVEPQPDGSTITRDFILHPGAAVILPVVDADHVCLLRNTRFVVDDMLWEIPAGTLEPGETPEQTAHRELAEETGYTAATMRALGFFYASPGVLDEKLHLFVAEGLTPGEQKLEADEHMVAHSIPWERALKWVFDGTIRDAKTATALLMWDRLRGK